MHLINSMVLILAAAPLFLIFEIWQLVICERHLGVKRLSKPWDPQEEKLSVRKSIFWLGALTLYWLWMGFAAAEPTTRAQAGALFATSLLGFFIRRQLTLKWILVALTFEGAIRVGMLVSISGRVWQMFSSGNFWE